MVLMGFLSFNFLCLILLWLIDFSELRLLVWELEIVQLITFAMIFIHIIYTDIYIDKRSKLKLSLGSLERLNLYFKFYKQLFLHSSRIRLTWLEFVVDLGKVEFREYSCFE